MQNSLKLEKLGCDKNYGVNGIMSKVQLSKLMDMAPLRPFHQSGNGEEMSWNFVEFWTNDQSLIINLLLEAFGEDGFEIF